MNITDWNQHKDVVPRKAAAALVLRGTGANPEVLLARRNTKLPFMGGHHVFPGGRIDDADADVPVSGVDDPEVRTAIAAAAREAFEEAGVLLATGSPPPAAVQAEARHQLLREERPFGAILADWGLSLEGHRFVPAGIWVTPPFSPIRYLTRYFVFVPDAPIEASVVEEDGEIVALDWIRAGDARRAWQLGELRLSTPIAFVLRHLGALPLEQALPWMRQTPGMDFESPNLFEMRRGVHLIPLRTPTVPPATHTNCVVIGEREYVVIDPGADDAEEQAHLETHLDHLLALGDRLANIVLTHSHPDHVGSAVRLRERYGAPIVAHAATAKQVAFDVDTIIGHDAAFDVAGDPGWRLRALHTPGHDPGHIALLEESTRTLLCGDMAANPGSIVVSLDHGGDMDDYLDSLEMLIEQDFTFLIPGHGLPLWGPAAKEKLATLHAHRLDREAKIQTAIDEGAKSIEDVLRTAYADTNESLWPFATLQLSAHLKRLGVSLEH